MESLNVELSVLPSGGVLNLRTAEDSGSLFWSMDSLLLTTEKHAALCVTQPVSSH